MKHTQKLIAATLFLSLTLQAQDKSTEDTGAYDKKPTTQKKILIKGLWDKFLKTPKAIEDKYEVNQALKKFTEAEIEAVLNKSTYPTKLSLENGVAFFNTAADFERISTKEYGFCGGITSITKKLIYLARFDEKNVAKQVVPDKKNQKEWAEFYLKLMKNIINKEEVTVIPYFKNIHDFTGDEILMDFFKLEAAEDWAQNAITTSAIEILSRAQKPMTVDAVLEQIHNVKKRVDKNELPIIMFSAFAQRPVGGVRIHNVMIWKIEQVSEGSYRLYTWETNTDASPANRDRNFIEVNISPTGELAMSYILWLEDHKKNTPAGKTMDPKAGQVAQILELDSDYGFMKKLIYKNLKFDKKLK